MSNEDQFLNALRVMAKRYKVKLNPKNLQWVRALFTSKEDFDCLLGNNCIVLLKLPK